MITDGHQFANLLFKELNLDPKATYYVAYSGGLDSSVLLHLMCKAQKLLGFKLIALHVNHNLQEESKWWALHAVSIGDKWGVEVRHISLELAENSEVAARNARYQWFNEQLSPGSVLLTAHHRQDRVETLLFNLMRGAGSRGLSSLRCVRPYNGSKLARPLLPFTREEIKQYAIENELDWIEDKTNLTDQFARNRIRHQIIPALTHFRQDAVQNIARAAENLEQENGLLNEIAICDLVEVREMARHPLDQSNAICYEDFVGLSRARQSNLVRFWLQSLQLHTPSHKLLIKLLDAFANKPSSTTVIQESGCQFRFYQGYMYVMPALEEALPIKAIDWRNLDQPIGLYEEKIRVDATTQLRELVRDRHANGLTLSSKLDVENPKALQGHSLNLKKWLQEVGIPPWRRSAMPLLTMQQSNTNIVLGPVDQQLHSDWVSLECPIN